MFKKINSLISSLVLDPKKSENEKHLNSFLLINLLISLLLLLIQGAILNFLTMAIYGGLFLFLLIVFLIRKKIKNKFVLLEIGYILVFIIGIPFANVFSGFGEKGILLLVLSFILPFIYFKKKGTIINLVLAVLAASGVIVFNELNNIFVIVYGYEWQGLFELVATLVLVSLAVVLFVTYKFKVYKKEISVQSNLLNKKNAFLQDLSYDLRNPLNVVVGMTNVALKSKDESKKIYNLNVIQDATEYLLGVTNSIIYMATLEDDSLSLQLDKFEIEQLVERVIHIINYRINEKRQNLVVQIDEFIPKVLFGDENKLVQVLSNLLTNAIRLTEKNGSIILYVKLLSKVDENCELQFDVIDNRLLPKEEEDFFTDTTTDKATNSLAFCKQVITLMQGKIWHSLNFEKDTVFSFTIPIRAINEGANYLSSLIEWNKINIFVGATNEKAIFEEVKNNYGLNITISETSSALSKSDYQVVFLEWSQIQKNASKLISSLKKKEGVKIFVFGNERDISALGDSIFREIDNYIPLPLFTHSILDNLNRAFAEQVEERDYKNIFLGFRILVVDDQEINKEILYSLLQETGISIDSASDGLEATISVLGEQNKFDLILMDVTMPHMDGLEATRQIRAYDTRVPIIAMTGKVFQKDIEECLASGMNAHLGKPFNANEVMEILIKYLIDKNQIETTTNNG